MVMLLYFLLFNIHRKELRLIWRHAETHIPLPQTHMRINRDVSFGNNRFLSDNGGLGENKRRRRWRKRRTDAQSPPFSCTWEERAEFLGTCLFAVWLSSAQICDSSSGSWLCARAHVGNKATLWFIIDSFSAFATRKTRTRDNGAVIVSLSFAIGLFAFLFTFSLDLNFSWLGALCSSPVIFTVSNSSGSNTYPAQPINHQGAFAN